MKLRMLWSAAAAAGLALPGFATAQQMVEPPAPALGQIDAADQLLADSVAQGVVKAGPLAGTSVDIACLGGVVDLSGKVQDARQAAEIERRAKSVAGVRAVRNRLSLPGGSIVQTQATQPLPAPQPEGGAGEPLPQRGPPMPTDLNPPKMPTYAWPTYAPHNNYSRVGYPNLYPHNAFPFIGPFYPFPKVPLSWRRVTLEWEDGHWFIGRNASAHDWWRLRYW